MPHWSSVQLSVRLKNPARKSGRHLKIIFVFSPWSKASLATDIFGAQAPIATSRLQAHTPRIKSARRSLVPDGL